jgi:hypothetical protein
MSVSVAADDFICSGSIASNVSSADVGPRVSGPDDLFDVSIPRLFVAERNCALSYPIAAENEQPNLGKLSQQQAPVILNMKRECSTTIVFFFFDYLPFLFWICIGWREMNGLIRTNADGAASKKVDWPI